MTPLDLINTCVFEQIQGLLFSDLSGPLSDSSDDDLYRLVLDPEGQGHQWKMIST